MWGQDGGIYFVSDREGNGLTNIWRVSDDGERAVQITSFKVATCAGRRSAVMAG